jgi:hypothetical protein
MSTLAPVFCLTAFNTSLMVEFLATIVSCPPWKLTCGGEDGPCSGVTGCAAGVGDGVLAATGCAGDGFAAFLAFIWCGVWPDAAPQSKTIQRR